MKNNEIFIKTSFKQPVEKEYALGDAFKVTIDAVVVAKQYNDLQDGTCDVIIKIKPSNVVVE